MNWQKVGGEAIDEVAFDQQGPDMGDLHIRFTSGGITTIRGVRPQDHQDLLQAESPGSFYHKHLRSR